MENLPTRIEPPNHITGSSQYAGCKATLTAGGVGLELCY